MVTRMLKSFYKLMIFLMFMSIISVAQNGYAQMQAMSTKEFSEKHLPAASSIFGGSSPKIMCGKSENMCDMNTQACLRCKKMHYKKVFGFKVFSHIEDDGKCVSLNGLDEEDLIKSWPSCSDKAEKRDYIIASKTVTRRLTLEPNGFLSQSEFKIIGIGTEHKEEFTDSNGNKYLLATDAGNVTIAYGERGKGCEILPVKIYNMQTCFFCPMTRILFKTINEVTKQSFETFGDSFAELILVMYVIWLAIISLKQVFAFTKQDASDYIEQILKQTFKFLMAYYILLNATFLFQYFVSPILSSGLRMGEMIQSTDLVQPAKKMDMKEVAMGGGYYNVKMAGGKTLYYNIENYLSSIQAQMAYLQAIGTSLFCVGTKQMTSEFSFFESWGEQLADAFRMMGLGMILTIIGFLLSIVFAFYFLDAIMQLGLLGMTMPLMIAGWPFAITKHLASKGMGFLFNTFFIFFFTGFVVSVNVILIDQSLTYSAQVKAEKVEAKNQANNGAANTSKEKSEGGLNAIAQALHSQQINKLKSATEIGGIGFLLLIFSALFGFKFIQQVTPLAGELAGGGAVKGVAGKLGGMAGSVAKGMAVKAVAPVKKAASQAWNKGGGAVGIVAGGVGYLAAKGRDALVARGKSGIMVKALNATSKGAGKVQNFAKSAKTAASKSEKKS